MELGERPGTVPNGRTINPVNHLLCRDTVQTRQEGSGKTREDAPWYML
jgi:hypothetical protein